MGSTEQLSSGHVFKAAFTLHHKNVAFLTGDLLTVQVVVLFEQLKNTK